MSKNELKIRALVPQGRGIWLPSGESAAVVALPTRYAQGAERHIGLIVIFDDPADLNQSDLDAFSKELIALIKVELSKDPPETRKLLDISPQGVYDLNRIEFESVHREV